ncbi:MAG TPA: hypothetical protein VNS46_00185 [Nocardioides sp.]|nr:hypothetical protein [Nocardioides sp.]
MTSKTITKTTEAGREYDVVDGRHLIWHAEVWDDEKPFDVAIPLRFKVRALRPLKGMTTDDADAVLDLFDAIAPDQKDEIDELDVSDLMVMFNVWLEEWKLVNGATVGEASGSST